MSAGQLQPDDKALCHQRRPALPPFLLVASLAVLLGVLWPELPLVAQPLEAGAPLITSLKPKAGNNASGLQVWAITEDDRGILYVGNNAGVVEYDGVDWRVLPVRNHSTVRSLSRGPDGTIYVGAQNEVGFLRPAGDGAVEYVSLFEHLPAKERRFADVWKTYATEHGVFFQTYRSLLLWDGQQFLSWRPQEGGSFHFSYWVAGELLIADLGRGLLRWTPRGLEPFPGGELFQWMRIYAVVPLKDGRLLIAPRGSSLYTLHEGRVTAFPTSVDRLLVEGSIYHALPLDDGTVALATIHHGIVVIDQQGQLVRRIDRESGLDTNRIAFLYTDRQRALWAALEQGVARIDLPSAFSQFGVADGLEGLPLAIQRVGPKLYIASTAGLYRLEAGQRDESGVALRPYLRRMPSITQQAWNLLVFDDRLLISTLDGVYEFFDRPPRLVWPGRSSWLYHSKRNPKRVFVALFDGLASIRREDDRWINEGRWPGIDTDVRSLAEDEDGVLWAGTAYEHVLRISLNHETGKLLEVQNLGEEYWPVPVDQFWVFETSRGVGVASNRGLFRYIEARDRFQHDTTFGEEFGNGEQGVSFVIEDAAGDVWIVPNASGEMKVARKQPDGSYRPQETPLQRLQPDTSASRLLRARRHHLAGIHRRPPPLRTESVGSAVEPAANPDPAGRLAGR